MEDGIDDRILMNPVESEIQVPDIHVQEDKYRLACEHHRVNVEDMRHASFVLAEHNKRVPKSVSGKMASKLGKVMGNPSERKRFEATLDKANTRLSEALELKAAAKSELDLAMQVQHEFVQKAQNSRKMQARKIEEDKAEEKAERQRVRAQKRLEAEQAALAKEERLREARELRHEREEELDRIIGEVSTKFP